MRTDYEQGIALECLRIAGGDVAWAEGMLAFVIGDSADAKAEPFSSQSENPPSERRPA